MSIIRFFLILFLLKIHLFLLAQNGGLVRGNVFDEKTTEPISFATVKIIGTDLGTITNEEGFFSISNVPAGNQQMVLSFLGYDSIVLDFRMETMRNKDLVSALVSDETEVEFENVRKILTSGWQ